MYEVVIKNRENNKVEKIVVEAQGSGDAWLKAKAIVSKEKKDSENWYIQTTHKIAES